MKIKVGVKYHSQVCDTTVIVVKAPDGDGDLLCGGHPMVPSGERLAADLTLDPAAATGTVIGKRYTDNAGLELLVVKSGQGTLSSAGSPMSVRQAKALPSSD